MAFSSFAFAFLAGALSTLSPCVLPMLPLVLGTALSRHRFGPLALALRPIAASAFSIAFTKSAFDRAAFDAAQVAGGPILLHVFATWCETCHAQRAVLDKLQGEPAFKAYMVFNIDFDAEKGVMRRFGAQSRSTLIVFKGKKEVGRLVGDTNEASIKALLEKAL